MRDATLEGEVMAYVNTGLFNNGQTQFFTILYDDSLVSSRGVDLAAELMAYCDSDFAWLNSFFPGVGPGTPITVKLPKFSNPADAGGSWSGWGPIPLEV